MQNFGIWREGAYSCRGPGLQSLQVRKQQLEMTLALQRSWRWKYKTEVHVSAAWERLLRFFLRNRRLRFLLALENQIRLF